MENQYSLELLVLILIVPAATIHMKKITDEYDLHLPAKNKGIQLIFVIVSDDINV